MEKSILSGDAAAGSRQLSANTAKASANAAAAAGKTTMDNKPPPDTNTSTKDMQLDLYVDSGVDMGIGSEAASATSSGYYSLMHEDTESQDEEDEDSFNEEEVEVQMTGECAMDLLFDAFNPTGKVVHDSLSSVKEKEEKAKETMQKLKEEKREEAKKRYKGRKEHRKLERKRTHLKNVNNELTARNKAIKARVAELEVEIKIAQKKYDELAIKFEKKYQEELATSNSLIQTVESMKTELYEQQQQRISNLTNKIAPIIVHGEPSRRTTYKLQLKYLQYEIHPLSQRLRLTHMRVEHEELKRRQIENETRILRDRISELVNQIGVITKGLPMNKIVLQDLPPKGKWKMLLSGMRASSILGRIIVCSPSPTLEPTPEPELLMWFS